MTILIEGCVETVAAARAAERGGARRLELCANLDVGGTTPDDDLVRAVRDAVQIPIIAMARPRGGRFVHTVAEIESIRRDIDRLAELGVAGVVFGVLHPDGTIDMETTRELAHRAAVAGGMEAVVHRAFDATPDLEQALDDLIECGVRRVLTGGGPGPAMDHVEMLDRLVSRSAGRIEILAGGKVRPGNAATLVREAGVRQLHARLGDDESGYRALVEQADLPARSGSGSGV